MKIFFFLSFFLFHLSWIIIVSSLAPVPADVGELPLPGFSAGWLGNKRVFQAGDLATIIINLPQSITGTGYAANFSLSVEGIKGNSSYVSSVVSFTEGDPTHWNITFVPIRAGEFMAAVIDEHSGATKTSLLYSVTPGALYPSASIASWMNLENKFTAGNNARILILPKDAFGNNVLSITEDSGSSTFDLSSSQEDGSAAAPLNFTYGSWDEWGRLEIEFVPVTAGRLLLHVASRNQSLTGSPLSFKVEPGPVDVKTCQGSWKYETKAIKIFSRLEFLVHQQDQFGNLVPGLYQFDARVVQRETNLSVPIPDLSFQEEGGGIQSLSFIVTEPGNFMLRVFDAEKNTSISNTCYEYSVFVGYCDGINSAANGSGLTNSVAGRMTYFSIYLQDSFHNPSPVEARILTVKILKKNDTTSIKSSIFPHKDLQGAAPSPDDQGPVVQSSAFTVIYVPERPGCYDIWIFCGNIPLNDGHSFAMNASSGAVDPSKSGVVQFAAKVKKLERNEVKVQLLDSLSNRAMLEEEKLRFNLVDNGSNFRRWPFEDDGEGLYVGFYEARELGTYNICILYENYSLSPCPFEINVFKNDYFPDAKNDSVSVWEDESVALDATGNDYFSASPARITCSSMPVHGSIVQQGLFFRYTPYKGFFGVDSFSYTLSDANDNIASATVFVSVLCKPPQFISLPSQLQATEDLIGPQFGGFEGFALTYCDRTENISVTIRAKSGSIFFSPMPYWGTTGGEFSVAKGGRTGRDIILSGNVEAINSALGSMQYLGDENFYGSDAISLSAANKNGMREARVAVWVNPVNDPPVIHVPKFVILEREPAEGGIPIFGGSLIDFVIGDPDLYFFPENESQFLVTLSLELSDGLLISSLPAHLIGKVELKIKNGYQWQHLQAFVTISNHFVIKAKGIRFRATVDECNSAIRKLLYQGSGPLSSLIININDMGNYGRCAECGEGKSAPLQAEATVNLIRRRSVNSFSAHLLGAAVVIEFVVLLLLGGALVFYICKCTNLLYGERTPAPASGDNSGSGRGGHESERETPEIHRGSNLRRRCVM